MSDYTNAPVTFENVGGFMYCQRGATAWDLGYKGSGHTEIVHDGTVFDVSIPAALRVFFSPHDPRYLKAAALHDELLIRGFDRVTAAGAFNAALMADKVSRARRLVMVTAVALYKFT